MRHARNACSKIKTTPVTIEQKNDMPVDLAKKNELRFSIPRMYLIVFHFSQDCLVATHLQWAAYGWDTQFTVEWRADS